MKTKNLVITSDDFGMSVGVNQGIYVAALSGHIQCTNYMVPTPFFEQAIIFSRDMPIDIGVHFTLTNEWDFYKWRSITQAKSLVDEEGYLYKNIKDLMQHASLDDIKAECYAQLELAKKRDPRVSFVDVHMCIPTIENNSVVNPSYELELLNLVREIANECGLVYPYELFGDRLKYFDTHLSISGKEIQVIEKYLSDMPAGNHHLSCHCSTDSAEQQCFSCEDSPASVWARDYRIADSEIISSAWFNNILKEKDINLIALSKLIER